MNNDETEQPMRVRSKERRTADQDSFALSYSVDEQVIAQQTIYCFDTDVIMVLTGADDCYVSLPASCKALGLNIRGQLQRIQRTPTFNERLRQLPLQTRGGTQRINCLPVNIVSEWLTSMHSRTLTETLQERIDLFLLILKESEQTLRSPSLPPEGRVQPRLETVVIVDTDPRSKVEEDVDAPVVLSEREPTLFLEQDDLEQVVQHSWLDQGDVSLDTVQEQRMLLTTLPGVNTAPILVTTGYQEDRAIREATLARQADWQEEPRSQRMRYIASNQLHVYLGDPEHPLTEVETSTVLQALGESTVLTARILFGLWNIRRMDHQLAKDGSAAIRIDDILEWRGVQKHHRALYPGAQKQSTDGYQWKHKQQAHQDIKLLELCHLRGYHTIMVKGKARQFSIDGPYLRVATIKETLGEAKEDIIGYFIAPGAWINSYEEHGTIHLIELDRRIFQLNPQNDQIALRIALYLTEHWRLHMKSGRYADPLMMQDLLAASMIPIDRANLTTRFIPRVESAIQKLRDRGIVGSAHPLTIVDRTQGRWGGEWLRMEWIILPPDDLLQSTKLPKQRAETYYAQPLLPEEKTE